MIAVQQRFDFADVWLIDGNVVTWLDGVDREIDDTVRYQPEEARRYWQGLRSLGESGRLVLIPQVRKELKLVHPEGDRRLATAARRAPRRSRRLVEAYREILSAYPRFANSMGKVGADPWLIAYARVYGWTILTEELPAAQARTKKARPKIPDVCDALDVGWSNLRGLAALTGW